MTGDNHGEAIIRLDGFRVTAFLKLKHLKTTTAYQIRKFPLQDSNNLDEVTVSDALGNPYSDFTNHIDHQALMLSIRCISKHVGNRLKQFLLKVF